MRKENEVWVYMLSIQPCQGRMIGNLFLIPMPQFLEFSKLNIFLMRISWSPNWVIVQVFFGVGVKKGVRWKLGNGNRISVWKHPWIRSKESSYVQTTPKPDLEDLKVCSLFYQSSGNWHESIIHDIFNPVDAQNILNMAIFQTNNEDVPIWKLSRDGKYLVKSAYYYILWRLLLITMIYVKLQISPLFGLFIILNV